MSLNCPDSQPIFLSFFDPRIAPPLLFYSYLPIIFVSLFFGLFVLFKDKYSLQSKLLFAISISFSLFLLNEIDQWIAAPVSVAFLGWVLASLFQIMVWMFSIYFFYAFLYKKALPIKNLIILFSFSLPIIAFLPSRLNFIQFAIDVCEGRIGILWYYLYAFEILSSIALFFWGIKVYRAEKEMIFKKQILLLTISISFFLLIFSLSNISGELLKNYGEIFKTYQINLLGPIGMVFFIGTLAFLIVRYHAFNIKLIGAQALVITLIILIGSQFFFIKTTTNFVLTGITFVLSIGFGLMLIRSVKEEVERKEELQKLTDSLAIANEQLEAMNQSKSEFISIASHQLRTPLTAIKGYISLLLEGSYGEISATVHDILDKVYSVNSRLVHLVEDLLNVSRIEAGRIQYSFALMQIEPVVAEVVDMFMPTAKVKNLSLKRQFPEKPLPQMTIDPNKIKETLSNLIDNSLKYTKEGGVTVTVEAGESVARIIVSDTGIGIRPEDKKNLFEKFIRSAETTKMVVSGAGLGLYVGKNFIEAHGGRLLAESAGAGQGSRFIIELPYVNPKIHVGTSDQPTTLKKV